MSSPEREAEKGKRGNGGKEEPLFKRTCVTSSVEPDVKVIVGEEVFYEYRQVLCCVSDYFDAMFRSDMQEAQTSTITLEDKDPREWELFVSTVVPCAKVQVNLSNVKTLLPWYDFFQVSSMLDRCDDLCYGKWFMYCGRLYEKDGKKNPIGALSADQTASMRAELRTLVGHLETAQQYRLVKSKNKACNMLGRIVTESPDILEEEDIRRVVTLLQDKDCRVELWPSIKQYLPDKYREKEDDDSFFKKDLLCDLLQSQIEAEEKEKRMQAMVGEALHWPALLYDSLPTTVHNIVCRDKMKGIMASDTWKNKVPEGWRNL